MSVELQLPAGTGMQRHGHVLTLSGYWDEELLDELQHGLLDLRQALPRAAGRKFVTLHLFNFSIAASAVNGALSLVRRAFVDLHTDVSVVAEGALTGAGPLFLAGSQQGQRKVFADTRIELRFSRRMGLTELHASNSIVETASMGAIPQPIPAEVHGQLLRNGVWSASPAELIAVGWADKRIDRV